jgi:uncharacterized protein
MILDLAASLLIGFFGSLHCLGMCGPLVMAYSLQFKNLDSPGQEISRPVSSSRFYHHLAFQAGRVGIYGLLGFLAAGLFHSLGLIFSMPFRGGLLLLGGGLVTLMGLAVLQVVPPPFFMKFFPGNSQAFSNRVYQAFFKNSSTASQMALGGACGLLPCCLSLSVLVKAALTENGLQGFLTMIAFGLGTVPALTALGLSASLLTLRTRLIGERLAAFSIIIMGLILAVQGGRILFRA